jgi:hypothetical protein
MEKIRFSKSEVVTKICDDCGKRMLNTSYSSILLQRERTDGIDRCAKCGTLYAKKIERENIPYDRSLEYFAKENKMEYLLKEYSDKNPLPPDKIYRACNDECYWICKECNSEFTSKVSTRTCYSCNCPYCAGIKVNKTNSLSVLYPDLIKEWHPSKNEDLSLSMMHFGSNKKAWWKCVENSEHEWEARISTRTIRKYGCPACAESKGEKRIRKWLEENNIRFTPQKEFKGLVGVGAGNLSYDFYLPKQNLLIEYQGQYHDGTVKKQTAEQYKYQLEHDKRKREYAHLNNIDLFEIWYWDFNNIEKILEEKLTI